MKYKFGTIAFTILLSILASGSGFAQENVLAQEEPEESFAKFLQLIRSERERDQAQRYFNAEMYIEKYNEAARSDNAFQPVANNFRDRFIEDLKRSFSASFFTAWGEPEIERDRADNSETEIRRNPQEARIVVTRTVSVVNEEGEAENQEMVYRVHLHLQRRRGIWQWYWIERIQVTPDVNPDVERGRGIPPMEVGDRIRQLREEESVVSNAQVRAERNLRTEERQIERSSRRLDEIRAELIEVYETDRPLGTPWKAVAAAIDALKRGEFEDFLAAHTEEARESFIDDPKTFDNLHAALGAWGSRQFDRPFTEPVHQMWIDEGSARVRDEGEPDSRQIVSFYVHHRLGSQVSYIVLLEVVVKKVGSEWLIEGGLAKLDAA
ncbi:MAG: hypothetical protein NUW37_17435 [Planctomycetes bacterium]|nr:hypothetical protein [Planctomycetota bacterium]